jgi:hypothetical protein
MVPNGNVVIGEWYRTGIWLFVNGTEGNVVMVNGTERECGYWRMVPNGNMVIGEWYRKQEQIAAAN